MKHEAEDESIRNELIGDYRILMKFYRLNRHLFMIGMVGCAALSSVYALIERKPIYENRFTLKVSFDSLPAIIEQVDLTRSLNKLFNSSHYQSMLIENVPMEHGGKRKNSLNHIGHPDTKYTLPINAPMKLVEFKSTDKEYEIEIFLYFPAKPAEVNIHEKVIPELNNIIRAHNRDKEEIHARSIRTNIEREKAVLSSLRKENDDTLEELEQEAILTRIHLAEISHTISKLVQVHKDKSLRPDATKEPKLREAQRDQISYTEYMTISTRDRIEELVQLVGLLKQKNTVEQDVVSNLESRILEINKRWSKIENKNLPIKTIHESVLNKLDNLGKSLSFDRNRSSLPEFELSNQYPNSVTERLTYSHQVLTYLLTGLFVGSGLSFLLALVRTILGSRLTIAYANFPATDSKPRLSEVSRASEKMT